MRDLITLMIISSDNSATDLVLERIGGLKPLNDWLATSGFRSTAMGMTNLENFRLAYVLANPKYQQLTGEEVYALNTADPSFSDLTADRIQTIQSEAKAAEQAYERLSKAEQDTFDAEHFANVFYGHSTPREMGQLLEGIERCTLAARASCLAMKTILKEQQLNDRIPGLLDLRYAYEWPAEGASAVAHKTGDSPPQAAIDVGIVYAKTGPIVVSLFANDNHGDYGELKYWMASLSRMIVEYFDGPPR
jgi:beta-lactamase class A